MLSIFYCALHAPIGESTGRTEAHNDIQQTDHSSSPVYLARPCIQELKSGIARALVTVPVWLTQRQLNNIIKPKTF